MGLRKFIQQIITSGDQSNRSEKQSRENDNNPEVLPYYTTTVRYSAYRIVKLLVKSSQPPHQVFGALVGEKIFPPGRTAKLQNNILMFQQRQEKSLYDVWTHFKDSLLKVPHHGHDLWLQVQIFYDHVDCTTQMAIEYAAGGRLRRLRPEVAWETIENLAQYEEE
ncbi:hypothetical protein Tco_0781905 [Tanacetum coccineum]